MDTGHYTVLANALTSLAMPVQVWPANNSQTRGGRHAHEHSRQTTLAHAYDVELIVRSHQFGADDEPWTRHYRWMLRSSLMLLLYEKAMVEH